MSDTVYTCIDPLQPDKPKATETAGLITGGVAGYFQTQRPEVAQELKARYPHMLVTPHEVQTNGRATRAVMWTVPEMPWKRNVANGPKAEQQTAQHTSPDRK